MAKELKQSVNVLSEPYFKCSGINGPFSPGPNGKCSLCWGCGVDQIKTGIQPQISPEYMKISCPPQYYCSCGHPISDMNSPCPRMDKCPRIKKSIIINGHMDINNLIESHSSSIHESVRFPPPPPPSLKPSPTTLSPSRLSLYDL